MKRRRHPFLFLIGYRICSVDREKIAAAIDLCRREKISYREVVFEGGRASFAVLFASSFKLIKKAAEQGLELSVEASRGIPALALRYRRRYGLMIGALLCAALFVLSGSVVWDVRVDGEKKLGEADVKALLSECGLSVGTRISSIDADVLENRVLIASDEISWISVNIIGTVAEVEIRELDFADREESEGDAVNIVADIGGRIVGFENIRGNIAVEIGEEVSEGQLLIGGIYGDEENGFRYTQAKGKVFAEIEREFEVTVERKASKKVYTGKTFCEKYLVFFEKKIKIFSNYRNLPTSCDKIEIEERISAPNGAELPLGMLEMRYLAYENAEFERSDGEMRDLAEYKLRALLESELAEAQILKRSTEAELSDDTLVLRCRIKCIYDIARAAPIGIK